MKKLFLFLIASIMMIAFSKQETNPFLMEWDTPYGLPPFNKIEEKHYLPALEAGIKEQEAEIEAIRKAYDHLGLIIFVIGFGSGCSTEKLKNMARLCKGQYSFGDTGDSLKSEFQAISTKLSTGSFAM